MRKEEARIALKNLEILKAFVEGKQIQVYLNNGWEDCDPNNLQFFTGCQYRAIEPIANFKMEIDLTFDQAMAIYACLNQNEYQFKESVKQTFGPGSIEQRPWDERNIPIENYYNQVWSAIDFPEKLNRYIFDAHCEHEFYKKWTQE